MSFFRQNAGVFVALGTGLFVGVSGAMLYVKLTNSMLREIQRLSGTIEELKAEVVELKEKLASSGTGSRNRRRAFYSASSGDDDDLYEDAYEDSRQSDLEIQNKTTEPAENSVKPVESKEDIFNQADKLLEGNDMDKEEAYNLLQNNKARFLTDADYHWRLAKATYNVAQIRGAEGNAESKKEMVYTSKDLAVTAVGLNDECANAHKWYAITIGSVGDYESTQQRIKNGYTFKDHIERATQLNPEDPSNHHLYGRWCFGVYMLTWIERKAAQALYATPPTATAEEALNHFLEADRLNPGKWKENMLYIGKSYIELGKYNEAVEWLKKANGLPVISQDDKTSQSEIDSLLSKYRN